MINYQFWSWVGSITPLQYPIGLCQLGSPHKIWVQYFEESVGRCGRNVSHGHDLSRFRQSCVQLVFFLCKSTEFHDMRTECFKEFSFISYLLFLTNC